MPGPAAAGGELEARIAAWAAELPPASWREVLGDAEGQTCGCGGQMRWTNAHTALICPGCSRWAISPGARERAGARIAATERKASQEVAITDAQARANRVQFRAWQDALSQNVDRLIGICDPDGFDLAQDQRAAFELAVTLRAYLPEIRSAGTESELSEIAGELEAIESSGQFRRLEDERADVAERRQAERDRQEQLAGQEREQQRQLAADQAAQRRQLEAAASTRRTGARALATAAPRGPWGDLAASVAEWQAIKARQVNTKGACAFDHRFAVGGTVPAGRFYGLQDYNGAPHPGLPSIRACRKHYDAAEAWMTQQGYPECIYWEL